MNHPYAQALANALTGLRAEDASSIDALLPLYDPHVEFRDPIQHLRGIDAFVDMNRRLLGRTKEIAFDVRAAMGDERTIFLAWSMRARPKFGPRIAVDGVTHADVRGGRVVTHRDYWDLGELATSPFPAAHKALQMLLRPLA